MAIALPSDFPHWSTVRTYFDHWRRKKVWCRLNHVLREQLRIEQRAMPACRKKQLAQRRFNSQSIGKNYRKKRMRPRAADRRKTKGLPACTRTKQGEVYGFDGGKKVKGAECTARQALELNSREPGGRKRHILVDTLGLLLKVIVTEGNGSERINGLALLLESEEYLDRLKLIWVDLGDQGARFEKAVEHLSSATVEVMKRQGKGFQLLARRWVVERTADPA